MMFERALFGRCRRFALAFGLALSAATAAQAQDAPPPASGVSYPEPALEQAAPEDLQDATPQAGAERLTLVERERHAVYRLDDAVRRVEPRLEVLHLEQRLSLDCHPKTLLYDLVVSFPLSIVKNGSRRL